MNMTPEVSESSDQPKPLHFIEQPDIVPVRDRPPLYLLRDDFSLLWRERLITVPAGFMSDGATIPRWLWSLTGYTPDGLVRAAALVHDWLYAHGGQIAPERDLPTWLFDPDDFHAVLTRLECDQLFCEICILSGVPVKTAHAWYFSLRLFGSSHWNVGLVTQKELYESGFLMERCMTHVNQSRSRAFTQMINATR